MEHAPAILEQNDISNWSGAKRIQGPSGKLDGKYHVPTTRLLHSLIEEVQKFGGEVLWKQLGTCDEKLKENSQLKTLNHSIVQAHFRLPQSRV